MMRVVRWHRRRRRILILLILLILRVRGFRRSVAEPEPALRPAGKPVQERRRAAEGGAGAGAETSPRMRMGRRGGGDGRARGGDRAETEPRASLTRGRSRTPEGASEGYPPRASASAEGEPAAVGSRGFARLPPDAGDARRRRVARRRAIPPGRARVVEASRGRVPVPRGVPAPAGLARALALVVAPSLRPALRGVRLGVGPAAAAAAVGVATVPTRAGLVARERGTHGDLVAGIRRGGAGDGGENRWTGRRGASRRKYTSRPRPRGA